MRLRSAKVGASMSRPTKANLKANCAGLQAEPQAQRFSREMRPRRRRRVARGEAEPRSGRKRPRDSARWRVLVCRPKTLRSESPLNTCKSQFFSAFSASLRLCVRKNSPPTAVFRFSGKSGQRRFARHTKARRIAESRTRLKRCASRFGLKFVAIGF